MSYPCNIFACSIANCCLSVSSNLREVFPYGFSQLLLYLQFQTNEVVSITFLSPNFSSKSLSLLFVN